MENALICQQQKEFFESGMTRKIEYRLAALANLRDAILEHEEEINAALYADLGKSDYEAYMTEIGITLNEISYMRRHLMKFARRRYYFAPLIHTFADSYMSPEPYGQVLILSPWNYPFLLAMGPLINALAAGNTALVKPSTSAPATCSIIDKIISQTLPPEYVYVVKGSREDNADLLNQKYDYIFFTGSKSGGKQMLRKAAKHLTPVTLKLGGKSPCVVDESADIALAARKIAFGKFLNAGQTCIAPDYILVHNSIKDKLLEELAKQITVQYSEDPLNNPQYSKIINEKHYLRLTKLINGESIFHGGKSNDLKIEPTIIDEIKEKSKLMKEEIFGPILPVLSYETLSEIKDIVAQNPTPLAFYLFSKSNDAKKELFEGIKFGGGCINDTLIHFASNKLAFGGVGESGMGYYRGKAGFDTFSHYKGVIDKKHLFDLPQRYQPYDQKHKKWLRFFLK